MLCVGAVLSTKGLQGVWHSVVRLTPATTSTTARTLLLRLQKQPRRLMQAQGLSLLINSDKEGTAGRKVPASHCTTAANLRHYYLPVPRHVFSLSCQVVAPFAKNFLPVFFNIISMVTPEQRGMLYRCFVTVPWL